MRTTYTYISASVYMCVCARMCKQYILSMYKYFTCVNLLRLI